MLRCAVQQMLTICTSISRAVMALFLRPQTARALSRSRRGVLSRSLTIGALGIGLVGVRPAAAAVNSVQSGTATLTNGNDKVDVTISAVSMSNSILFFNVSGNSNTPRDGMLWGAIETPTKLRFRRDGDTALTTMTIRWHVVEFSSGVSVQRAATSLLSSTHNVTINAVDLSKSFVLMSSESGGGSLTYGGDTYVRGRLTSSTNLELSQDAGASLRPQVHWQVVEYAGASVQRGTGSLTTTATSATAAITSVDLSKSIVLISWQTNTAGTGANFLRARLTSATQVTIDRGNSTSATIDYAWEVIEFNDGASVQSGDTAFSTAQTSQTATLTSVDLTRSVALLSTAGGGWGGSHAYTADD